MLKAHRPPSYTLVLTHILTAQMLGQTNSVTQPQQHLNTNETQTLPSILLSNFKLKADFPLIGLKGHSYAPEGCCSNAPPILTTGKLTVDLEESLRAETSSFPSLQRLPVTVVPRGVAGH